MKKFLLTTVVMVGSVVLVGVVVVGRLVERFARELGIDEREGAAEAADAYLSSQGDNGYVSRDPREVFENSESFVFVCVSGRVRNRSLRRSGTPLATSLTTQRLGRDEG
jgi:hypothetical protein